VCGPEFLDRRLAVIGNLISGKEILVDMVSGVIVRIASVVVGC
jgi:ABC-type antimicrobial peptide transport system ATPase subunit